jgi:hypothetical protein
MRTVIVSVRVPRPELPSSRLYEVWQNSFGRAFGCFRSSAARKAVTCVANWQIDTHARNRRPQKWQPAPLRKQYLGNPAMRAHAS